MDTPLFASLFDEEIVRPWSVSQLNEEITRTVERSFANIWVEGEITSFNVASSKHWYFSLTDGDSFIKAACFRNQNFRIRFLPKNGMQVRVRGRIAFFGPRSELQIQAESIEPVGEGALIVAFEQIKDRLFREGMLDRSVKRSLPQYPRKVGIVTSPSGAALQDILTVLGRRAESVSVLVIPTRVQGENAGQQIAQAIGRANEYSIHCPETQKIDVLIIARGGGSAEDLWAFNEEVVARSIRSSLIPVISAVGHEIDLTIADLAADLRAPTPSAAAELVVRAEAEIVQNLHRSEMSLVRAMNTRMAAANARSRALESSRAFTEFPKRVSSMKDHVERSAEAAVRLARSLVRLRTARLNEDALRISPQWLAAEVRADREKLESFAQRQVAAAGALLNERSGQLEHAIARLNAMSPSNVLDRGYSITYGHNGKVLLDTSVVKVGEKLRIKLAKGTIEATVDRTTD